MSDMSETSPQDLVALLARQELRIRTGVLELPVELLGSEDNLAVSLGVGHWDLCAWKVDTSPVDRTHLGLSWEVIIHDLGTLVSDISVPGYCVWISGLDVLLAAIPFADRKRLWDFIRSTFRQPRGLLLSMPRNAVRLLPEDERSLWLEYGRLSTWTHSAWKA